MVIGGARPILSVIFFGIFFSIPTFAQQSSAPIDYHLNNFNNLNNGLRGGPRGAYWLQVAAFGDWSSATRYAAELSAAGETPVWGAVDIPGLGRWIRVFVGSFDNQAEARRYAQSLIKRRLISSFLVRPISELEKLESPRNPARENLARRGVSDFEKERRTEPSAPTASFVDPVQLRIQIRHEVETSAALVSKPLPPASGIDLALLTRIDPRPLRASDPVQMALAAVLELPRGTGGGLKLTGDVEEGIGRLRWMVGSDNASLVSIDENGMVGIDLSSLANRLAGNRRDAGTTALLLSNAIALNEGLRLLVQLTCGPDMYQLHIGSSINLNGGNIAVSGTINLDNNYDRRINPSRQDGRKLPSERPAEGFDSLVVINPSARWFNLESNRLVSPGAIAFHELAEAYAKVHLHLQYLPSAAGAGAHATAVARELKLRSERWDSDIVVSAGLNRVFKSERDVYRYLSQARADAGQ